MILGNIEVPQKKMHYNLYETSVFASFFFYMATVEAFINKVEGSVCMSNIRPLKETEIKNVSQVDRKYYLINKGKQTMIKILNGNSE